VHIIANASKVEIRKAAEALRDGQLVAFPTETVYGLGADAMNRKAVERVYSTKGRPSDHPVIVHIASINQIDNWAIEVPEYAINLARKFWPGPLTLILKRGENAKDFVTGGQDSVGLRVPSDTTALSLLRKFEEYGGLGVAAPSANRFGAVSPTSAIAVLEDIGESLQSEDVILDGGNCAIGIESTIVDCTSKSPKLLRPGTITLKALSTFIDLDYVDPSNQKNFKAPGMLKSHYAPKAAVVVNGEAKFGDGYIALAGRTTPHGAVRLASPKTTDEFAYELYRAFRAADKLNLKRIIINLPDEEGIGLAIKDRVSKAANIL
jgi:L-threonylcarbamoyladenylate synthase